MRPVIWLTLFALAVALALVVGCDANVQLGVLPASDAAAVDAADAGAGS